VDNRVGDYRASVGLPLDKKLPQNKKKNKSKFRNNKKIISFYI
jgi:hypothetical protein